MERRALLVAVAVSSLAFAQAPELDGGVDGGITDAGSPSEKASSALSTQPTPVKAGQICPFDGVLLTPEKSFEISEKCRVAESENEKLRKALQEAAPPVKEVPTIQKEPETVKVEAKEETHWSWAAGGFVIGILVGAVGGILLVGSQSSRGR